MTHNEQNAEAETAQPKTITGLLTIWAKIVISHTRLLEDRVWNKGLLGRRDEEALDEEPLEEQVFTGFDKDNWWSYF